MSGAFLPHHRVRITRAIREDLLIWLQFLDGFNGVSLFFVEEETVWQIQLFSDASGAHGFRLFWEGRWCAERWPSHWIHQGQSIAFLELFPLIVALVVWHREFRDRSILFHVDNMAVVNLINTQKARDTRVLRLLRCFMLHSLRLNMVFKAKHIAGVNNVIADALSRFNWQKFHELVPGVDTCKTPVPPDIWVMGD